MRPAIFLALSFVVSLTNCTVRTDREYPTRTEHEKIARDKSEMTRAEFTMPAGELHVSSGTNELMEGDFTFNDPAFEPQVRYNNSSFRSVLHLEQRAHMASTGKSESKWDVRLNEEVPLDVQVEMGAGQSRLDFGKLNLRSVEVKLGAGEVKLDLRGNPKHDYDVTVRGGVGEATIWVPKSARVTAEASGGIGGIQVHGFNQKNGRYENESDKDAQVRIHLDVKGGIGAINLYSE